MVKQLTASRSGADNDLAAILWSTMRFKSSLMASALTSSSLQRFSMGSTSFIYKQKHKEIVQERGARQTNKQTNKQTNYSPEADDTPGTGTKQKSNSKF